MGLSLRYNRLGSTRSRKVGPTSSVAVGEMRREMHILSTSLSAVSPRWNHSEPQGTSARFEYSNRGKLSHFFCFSGVSSDGNSQAKLRCDSSGLEVTAEAANHNAAQA